MTDELTLPQAIEMAEEIGTVADDPMRELDVIRTCGVALITLPAVRRDAVIAYLRERFARSTIVDILALFAGEIKQLKTDNALLKQTLARTEGEKNGLIHRYARLEEKLGRLEQSPTKARKADV